MAEKLRRFWYWLIGQPHAQVNQPMEQEVKRLLKRFCAYPTPRMHDETSLELGKLGEPAVSILIKEFRYCNSLAMAETTDDGVLLPGRVREVISISLAHIGRPALTPLIHALRDSHSAVRAGAAETLGHMDDPRATTSLIAALREPNDDVRYHIVSALAMRKDPRAIEPLIRLLGHSSENFKPIVRAALVSIGPPSIIPVLTAVTAGRIRSEDARAITNHIRLLCKISADRGTVNSSERPPDISHAIHQIPPLGITPVVQRLRL